MEITTQTVIGDEGRALITVSGSLDIASRQTLVEAATAALDSPGTTSLAIDLSAVDFIDSSGVGALVQLAGDCTDSDRAFAIVAPSAKVTRILQITGLYGEWDIQTG